MKIIIIGLMFVLAIILAGSESAPPIWPWPNVVGVALMFVVARLSQEDTECS